MKIFACPKGTPCLSVVLKSAEILSILENWDRFPEMIQNDPDMGLLKAHCAQLKNAAENDILDRAAPPIPEVNSAIPRTLMAGLEEIPTLNDDDFDFDDEEDEEY